MHHKKSNIKLDKNHIYPEDIMDDEDQDYTSIKHVNANARNDENDNHLHIRQHQIDDDSMRRHEIDRGSDINYDRGNSLKRQQAAQEEANISGRDQLFIKQGNAEILRLITRGNATDDNVYSNMPNNNRQQQQQPQYIMVDNGGKEILMRRYIEEQANGKQIIREHYQVVPNTTYVQTTLPPNEVRENAQQQQATTSQAPPPVTEEQNLVVPEIPDTHTLIQQELENSLKTQNELLRQILLDKEKLEEKYNQQEALLETQSLPCHSMTAAATTQTDCEIAVQTDPVSDPAVAREALAARKTRSENDDSESEDDVEYVRYSPPNSPEGIYWMKRRRTRKSKSKVKDPSDPPTKHRRTITMESVKRKIRTPIQEEREDSHKSPKARGMDNRASQLRLLKNGSDRMKMLKKDPSMDIPDYDDEIVPNIKKKSSKHMKYFIDDTDGSENEVHLHKNYYSADSLDNDYYEEDRVNDDNKRRMTESVPPTPAIRQRGGRRERDREREREPDRKIQFRKSEEPRIKLKTHRGPDTSKGVPRYMEWYVKNKETAKNQQNLLYSSKRKPFRASHENLDEASKLKPEPLPRSSPTKENVTRMMKEDIQMAKKVDSRTSLNDSSNHPRLQYSEHRYEHEYQPQPSIPVPPSKLPHYMYPNTPPIQGEKPIIKYKPHTSPIQENEIKESKTTTTIKIPIGQTGTSSSNITTISTTTTSIPQPQTHLHHQPKEDDHDSGIAMNSLLLGKRNRIADKKSVFTIAYDDVHIKRLQSESDTTPPFS